MPRGFAFATGSVGERLVAFLHGEGVVVGWQNSPDHALLSVPHHEVGHLFIPISPFGSKQVVRPTEKPDICESGGAAASQWNNMIKLQPESTGAAAFGERIHKRAAAAISHPNVTLHGDGDITRSA